MSRSSDFSISSRREGEATVVAPAGEVDLVTVHEVRESMRAAEGCASGAGCAAGASTSGADFAAAWFSARTASQISSR